MKQSLSVGSEQQVRQSQTTNNRSATSEIQSFVDNRPQTIAQRQLISTIHASPQMIAQRQQAGSIHNSSCMAAQRELSRSLQSPSVQLQAAPEEEMLQGRFETVQRVKEDEELLQGKFSVAQRVEEEEPLQGKFDAAQRVEEEELLQGKFEAVQRIEEEEPLQGKFVTAQRVEEEELLQGKFEPVQRVEEDELLQGKFEATQLAEASAERQNNTGLPDNLKSGIEHLSGISMDNVKVHYNSSQPAQLNALAYAQGADIHVAPGQEQHLPHEAWHVVQQAQGRVRPMMQMKVGVPVNDDAGLEAEADVMGARALQMSFSSDGHQRRALASGRVDSGVKQLASFLYVKRIANGGNLFMGKSTAGMPALAYGGGTNWYGPKATAAEYGQAPGAIWRVTATRALNLIDMGTADSVKWAMEETLRRRGAAGLTPNLQAVLGNFDFAYAIPNAVAAVADSYLQYAHDSFAGLAPAWPGDHYNVDQAQMDGTLQLAQNAAEVPLWAGSVIQTFAGHTSGNAVRLDNAAFIANPNNYQILRKDATNLDAGFANELLNNLNDPALFHGLHVPLGVKFGGWTGTKFEILIKDSPNNLALHGQVAANGPEADMAVTDKTIAVDDSKLAWAWRFFGGNK